MIDYIGTDNTKCTRRACIQAILVLRRVEVCWSVCAESGTQNGRLAHIGTCMRICVGIVSMKGCLVRPARARSRETGKFVQQHIECLLCFDEHRVHAGHAERTHDVDVMYVDV